MPEKRVRVNSDGAIEALTCYTLPMPNVLMPEKTKLLSILRMDEPQKETMQGVVSRLESLVKIFRAHMQYRGFIAFAETYRLIARGVMLIPTRRRDFFTHLESLNRLNVDFIAYYFRAFSEYLETGVAPTPWKTYFEYCLKPKGVPFLQMLLGVNAHINGDFPHAMREMHYSDVHDFRRMNELLEDEVPLIMRFLAFEMKDRLAFGGVIFQKLARKEFHQIVTRWRDESWQSALALESGSLSAATLAATTEAIGQHLIDIFGDSSTFLGVRNDLKRAHGLEALLKDARA